MRLRKLLLFTTMAVAVPLGAASLAYACTALATLNLSSAGYAPGATVTGTGKGFNGGGHGTPAGSTPVELRWNTRSGPLLTTTAPMDSAGNIAFSFQAPNVPAGSYVLIAVQTNPANGTPFYGTPARQSIRIVAAPGRTTEAKSAAAETSEAHVATAPQAAGGPLTAPAGQTAADAQAGAQPAARAQVGAQPGPGPAAGRAGVSSAAPLLTTGPEAGSSGQAAATGASQTPAAEAGPSAVPAASALEEDPASSSAAPMTTATPDLVSPISSATRSGSPAVLLILLGLSIGVTVSACWLTSRISQRRDCLTAAA